MRQKSLCLLVIAFVAGSLSSCGGVSSSLSSSYEAVSSASSSSGLSISQKKADLYLLEPENKVSVQLAFFNGQNDIPFMDMSDFHQMVVDTLPFFEFEGTSFDFSSDNEVFTLINSFTKASVAFDFGAKTICFSERNSFFQSDYQVNGLDVIYSSYVNEKGEYEYIKHQTELSTNRTDSSYTIHLEDYGIPSYYQDGHGYLPLQTLSDVVLSGFLILAAYNGESVFITGGSISDLSDLYYSVPAGTRSPALIKFTRDELILALDMNYGLKEEHGIDSFANFFESTPLDSLLLSSNSVDAAKGIMKLCYNYFSDFHSGIINYSPYVGKDPGQFDTSDLYSASFLERQQRKYLYTSARKAAYPNGISSYAEVGNTAYITFDTFNLYDSDYYTNPAAENASDTFGLMEYAYSKIKRDASPIENVVLDLSCNRGGVADAAIYVLGLFLNYPSISVHSTITGAECTTCYKCDMNMDHVFDKNDVLSSMNLFCLTSPVSFSCGNLVPAMFKQSGRVTLIGQPSDGGACVVCPLSLADGTIFQISGSLKLCTVKNGSYYSIDRGIEPDYYLSKPADFYNRDTLTSYINSLS